MPLNKESKTEVSVDLMKENGFTLKKKKARS